MCNISGGGIGGILGSLGGGLLDIAFPEVGIPLSLAAGLGGFGGTLAGDVASGKSLGASIVPALETGGISGALAGVGNLAAGGDFFGAPASSLTGIFSGAPSATADTLAGTTTAATQGVAPAATLSTAAPAATTAGTGASAAGAGAGAGAPLSGIGASTGSAAPSIGGALPTASGTSLIGPTGDVGPLGAAGPVSSSADTGGAGNLFSGLFHSGTNPAATADLVQGGAPLAPNISSTNLAALGALNPGDPGLAAATATGAGGTGSSSFLSRGLFGEPGSIVGDLTKPSTLITGGAALLPLLQGNTIPGLSNLQNQANAYNVTGTPLAQSLMTGNLPAGAQSSLDAQTRAGEAAVRSAYARMGLSGSSQEADQIAGVQAAAAGQKVKMLEDLTNIGTGMMARADPLLGTIMTTRLQQDQQQQQAIARLAAALAGSTGTEKTTA